MPVAPPAGSGTQQHDRATWYTTLTAAVSWALAGAGAIATVAVHFPGILVMLVLGLAIAASVAAVQHRTRVELVQVISEALAPVEEESTVPPGVAAKIYDLGKRAGWEDPAS